MGRRVRHVIHNVANAGAQVALLGNVGVSGSPVDTWTGLPGTTINATGSGAARPTTTTLNGQGALLFDGTDDLLTMSAGAASLFQNIGQGRVFAVCSDTNNAGGTAGHPVTLWSAGAGASRHQLATRFTSTSGCYLFIRRLDADALATSGPLGSGAGAVILEANHDWSGNAHTVVRSGLVGTVATTPSGGGLTSNTASATTRIAASGASFFPGPIAAVIATNQAWSTQLAKRFRHSLGFYYKITCS